METNRISAGGRIAIIEDDVPLRETLSLFLRDFSLLRRGRSSDACRPLT
jgi:hypothetical protein